MAACTFGSSTKFVSIQSLNRLDSAGRRAASDSGPSPTVTDASATSEVRIGVVASASSTGGSVAAATNVVPPTAEGCASGVGSFSPWIENLTTAARAAVAAILRTFFCFQKGGFDRSFATSSSRNALFGHFVVVHRTKLPSGSRVVNVGRTGLRWWTNLAALLPSAQLSSPHPSRWEANPFNRRSEGQDPGRATLSGPTPIGQKVEDVDHEHRPKCFRVREGRRRRRRPFLLCAGRCSESNDVHHRAGVPAIPGATVGGGLPLWHCAFIPANFPSLGRLDEATRRVVFPGALGPPFP